MSQEDLLRVAGFASEPEAQIAQAMLAEHGINASIDNGESALGFDLVDMDEIDLIVMRQDFDRAKELIDEMEALQDEDQEPVPAWTCQMWRRSGRRVFRLLVLRSRLSTRGRMSARRPRRKESGDPLLTGGPFVDGSIRWRRQKRGDLASNVDVSETRKS